MNGTSSFSPNKQVYRPLLLAEFHNCDKVSVPSPLFRFVIR